MESLISVIVPVYNVESYLDKCIESIVNQTYKNLEIILVEDGSPDNCSIICDLWKKKDSRIKVIHQKNLGGGAARNEGLKIAKGDFISFIDSDDLIFNTMYEDLIKCFDEDTDIVECDFIEFKSNTNSKKEYSGNIEIKKFSVLDAMKLHLEDKMFRQLIWNKLYRKSVVEGIYFPIDKKIDDEFWTYQAIGKCQNLKKISKILYAYRQQENSVMHTIDLNRKIQGIEAKKRRHDYIIEKFPSLENVSYVSVYELSLYYGQKALEIKNREERNRVYFEIKKGLSKKYLLNILKSYPMENKQKFWILLTAISFSFSCKLRNFLKIGI